LPPQHADDEVHGDEHQLPEHVEEEEVEGDEGAEHAHFKEQERERELFDLRIDGLPRREERDGR
jgi:hypothetical protein